MAKKLDASKLTLGLKKEINKEHTSITTGDQIEKVVKIIHQSSESEMNLQEQEPTKRTTLDIPKSLHKKISQRALDKDLYLKDYFLELVKKDLTIE